MGAMDESAPELGRTGDTARRTRATTNLSTPKIGRTGDIAQRTHQPNAKRLGKKTQQQKKCIAAVQARHTTHNSPNPSFNTTFRKHQHQHRVRIQQLFLFISIVSYTLKHGLHITETKQAWPPAESLLWLNPKLPFPTTPALYTTPHYKKPAFLGSFYGNE